MWGRAMRYVSYLRVSTQQQGSTGLGIEAQRTAVAGYVAGKGELVAEFVEVESGRRTDRAKLREALAACRVWGATLVIAKLDRLARNVAFVANLMDAGVEFVAVDFPMANRLTVHILAAVAEHEAGMTSARTRAALAAARARGVRLGNPQNLRATDADRAKGREAGTRRANEKARDLAATIASIRAGGVTSATGIARVLTERRIPTPRGGETWQVVQVQRLLARLDSAQQVAA
jgi:DNA invertase Pin-like site-specific DNA recombinase